MKDFQEGTGMIGSTFEDGGTGGSSRMEGRVMNFGNERRDNQIRQEATAII